MSWYKQSQNKITLLHYDDGILTTLINGIEITYEGVDRECLNKLMKMIKWWQYNQAQDFLLNFRII